MRNKHTEVEEVVKLGGKVIDYEGDLRPNGRKEIIKALTKEGDRRAKEERERCIAVLSKTNFYTWAIETQGMIIRKIKEALTQNKV